MFVTKKALARRLGVCPGTISNLIRQGALPPPLSTAGGQILWPKSVIDEWLEDADPDPVGLVKIDELAAVLKVSVKTVRRMRSRGELPPPMKIGRQLRWRPQDLQEWLSTL